MKKSFQTLIFLLFALLTQAQSIEQIKADRRTYLWGEGSGVTLNRADQEALGMLINQISAQVESSFLTSTLKNQ